MRKYFIVAALLCAAVLATPTAGVAATNGPGDPGEPYTETVDASLTVIPPAGGSISSDTGAISCPGDCSEDLSYERECTPVAPGRTVCDDGNPATLTLTASRGPGWTASWTGCSSEPAANQCTVKVTGDMTVSLTWRDTGGPNVAFQGAQPPVAGPATTFSASAWDPQTGGVASVSFYVDNVWRSTDYSAPYTYNPSHLTANDHNGTRTLKVIATDFYGNSSSPLDTAPSHVFTVDSVTDFVDLGTPAALVNAAPAVSFTPPADVKAGGVACRTKRGAAVLGDTSACASPYTAQLGSSPPDGLYTLEFTVTDQAGNTVTRTRTFTLDGTAPQVSITGGPAEGAVVQAASVSFNFTGSDANGVTLSCKVDSGAFGPCSGADSHAVNGLGAGSHTFVVRATDGAGNTTDASRAFTTEAPPAAGGGNNAGPGTGTGAGTDPGPGTGTGAPAGPDEPAQPLVVAARSTPRWSVRGGTTRVVRLVLSGLERAARVQVTCKGRGCAFKSKKLAAKRSKLDLTKLFKKRKLSSRAVIEVRVTSAGKTGRVFRYTTQKGKKKPKVKTLCLPAGSSRPAAC